MNPDHREPLEIRAGVITVSSTRSNATDSSGKIIIGLLNGAGIPTEYLGIVPDSIAEIRETLIDGLKSCNCLILNGGTGLTHDDCTIEAVEPLYEKKIEGFGELFRLKSLDEVGTSAMLSRASGGIIQKKAVFCIPGSNGAVTLATKELILPEIVHILTHARK
jgi:molybdopterin adenylyltransferase